MNDKRTVEFVIYAPQARQVFLMGTFTDRDKLPMMKIESGLWVAGIEVPPGKYEYRFMVDSEWVDNVPGCVQVDKICVQDVPAAKRVTNSFGSLNCLLVI